MKSTPFPSPPRKCLNHASEGADFLFAHLGADEGGADVSAHQVAFFWRVEETGLVQLIFQMFEHADEIITLCRFCGLIGKTGGSSAPALTKKDLGYHHNDQINFEKKHIHY